MQVVRRFFLFITTSLFITLLMVVAGSWTIRQTIGDRTVVKSWFSDSGVYDNAVGELSTELQKDASEFSDQQSEAFNVDPTVVQTAVEDAFSPQFLQTNAENIIDGIYDWLEGSADQITFTADFSGQKTAIIDSLATQAKDRVAELPPCSISDLQSIDVNNIDPYEIACSPPIGVNEAIAQLRGELANNDEFLSDTTITGEDLKIEKDGEQLRLDQAFPEAPQWYQSAMNVAWIATVITVLVGVIVILLSQTRRDGFKHLAKAFAFGALFLGFLGIITSKINDLLVGDEVSMRIAKPFVGEVVSALSKWTYTFAAIYAVLFVVCVIVVLITRKKHSHPLPLQDQQNHTVTDSLPKPAEEQKANNPSDTSTDTQQEEKLPKELPKPQTRENPTKTT